MTTIPSVALAPARRAPGSVLIRVQLVLAGAYVAAIVIALARAASLSGHLYLPHQGDEYTGNADIWPGAMYLLWWVLILAIGAGPMAAFITAIVSAVQLSTRRLRAEPARWRAVLACTLLSVLVFAVSLTPASATVLAWLMD